MYLPDVNSISQRKPLVRNNSYRWMNSHSSDESCSLSDCSPITRNMPEESKKESHNVKRKRKKVNKLVIPIGAPDKTIRIYVPPRTPAIQHKSTINRMIDDFHANLPPASDDDSAAYPSTNFPSNPDTVREKAGTFNSRMSMWSVNSSAASFDYHQVKGSNNWKNTLVKTKDKPKDGSSHVKEAKPILGKVIETIEDEYEPVGNPLPQLCPKMSIQTRTKLVENINSSWNTNEQIIKETSSSCYVKSTRQSNEDKMNAKISENEYMLNNFCEYGLKHRDLN
jgi:hypothetical protein